MMMRKKRNNSPHRTHAFHFKYHRIEYAKVEGVCNISSVRKMLPDVAVWREELKEMETFLEEVGLTRTICHCDVHGRNIVYNDKTGTWSLY